MARKPKKKNLAHLENSDRLEFIRRRNLVMTKNDELMAVCAFMDDLHQSLREKYDLPAKFDINTETGYVMEVEDAEAASV